MMCLIVYNFQICSKKKKKNWAALPLVNTYFSLAPFPEFPGQKLRKCGQTSFFSDVKLYTISLQSPNKKNSPVNLGASSLNFTGTLLHGFCLVISTSKALFSGGGGCILLSTSSYFGSFMNGKGDKFQLGIKFLYDLDRLFVICLLVKTFGDQYCRQFCQRQYRPHGPFFSMSIPLDI